MSLTVSSHLVHCGWKQVEAIRTVDDFQLWILALNLEPLAALLTHGPHHLLSGADTPAC